MKNTPESGSAPLDTQESGSNKPELSTDEQAPARITLVIERGATKNIEELPKRSIALDGYCQGPVIDPTNERYSFDHHANCTRLVTSATCRQVMDAILLGMDPEDFNVYVNDVDGDTVLAAWLLKNPERASEPKVRELVSAVNDMDAHGPAYASANPELARLFYDGVMAPEKEVRLNKTYATCDLTELLDSCLKRIDMLLSGELQLPPEEAENRTYEVTHEGTGGWAMVQSNDFIYDLLYANGINKAVAYKVLPDGSINYTVGKKSEFVSGFPVGPGDKPGTILYELNQRESGWGGGSTIGGSPRNADGSRSRLSPEEVFQTIEEVVARQSQQ